MLWDQWPLASASLFSPESTHLSVDYMEYFIPAPEGKCTCSLLAVSLLEGRRLSPVGNALPSSSQETGRQRSRDAEAWL